ncbi:hypothetical protein A2310_03830 [candidate division WOR-1 bacterium RIFOXYB2_FULL_37_13]|uniref:PpiC domain-containing protein n=1 Tax=candidate division WOR-1 bacterium RIFOXYB2_FULL_37_13 TaxID=1802579 RepID=A0A1F4SL49_UNCSA|nr:MAG: hypothetical protein A2310_03830 [candidate division WOR-1 bacterium RIFOXYB2_FULL_37_13]
MLTYLRKNMKGIMIVVAILFGFSMFYGIGFTGLKQFSDNSKKTQGFLKVNGKEINPMRFNNIFSRLRANFPDRINPSDILFLQNMALSQTIDFSIILDEARKTVGVSGGELNLALEQIAKQEKLTTVAELKKAVESSHIPWDKFKKMIKDDLLVQKMTSQINNSVMVSPNDLREIRASHILVKTKELADEIKNKIQKGGDFAAQAKKYSQDLGTKNKGGDLGFFSSGMMVKPFEDMAFSLAVSEVSEPVKTDYGYHIIKVTDARLRKIQGQKDIEAAVLKEKQANAYKEWFYNLKKNAKIEILDPGLKALDLRFKGQISGAIKEYNRAISLDPGNAYLKLFLGLLYEDSKNLKQAIFQYREAVQLEPANPVLYMVLGKAYIKDNQKGLAIEQLKKASLIAGDDKGMHKELQKEFAALKLSSLAAGERDEIIRIEKKEAFEEELREKTSDSKEKIVID